MSATGLLVRGAGLDEGAIVSNYESDNLTILRRAALGDLNCNNRVDNFDITPFVAALSLDQETYERFYLGCSRMLADINQDGEVNNFDLDAFVTVVAGR